MFVGSFQYKTKYNITWFSQENLKNYKDVVTNSKLGEFYFYSNIAPQISCNSMTHQKSETKKKTITFFLFRKLHNKKAKIGVLNDLQIKISLAPQPRWVVLLRSIQK